MDPPPKIVGGKRVQRAGNFATAERFEPGVQQMERKEEVGGEEKGKGWAKGGYRKYRDSGMPESGLLGGARV